MRPIATRLSEEQLRALRELEADFDGHVEGYRAQKARELADGGSKALEVELTHLEGYLEGCRRGQIAHVAIDRRFVQAKTLVLSVLLEASQ